MPSFQQNKETYFGISYTFGRENVRRAIDERIISRKSTCVVVADGVTLTMSTKNKALKQAVDDADIVTCDSGWVPLYLRSIYHIQREQYTGSDLMMDLIQSRKYKMMFLGASENTLQALQKQISTIDPRITQMSFAPLPFLNVNQFNYSEIAELIRANNPDIILVSLGMPKQEFFMHRLKPLLESGILIGVGAAFKFHSGLTNQKRAPLWMIKHKIEWLYRIFSEPKKQIKRSLLIIFYLPRIYLKEYLLSLRLQTHK